MLDKQVSPLRHLGRRFFLVLLGSELEDIPELLPQVRQVARDIVGLNNKVGISDLKKAFKKSLQ